MIASEGSEGKSKVDKEAIPDDMREDLKGKGKAEEETTPDVSEASGDTVKPPASPPKAHSPDECRSTTPTQTAASALPPIIEEDSSLSEASSATPTPPDAPKPIARPVKFDELDPRLRCRLPDCRSITSCHDGSSKYCPACSTISYVRYCSKAHLYEDIKRHHGSECCTLPVPNGLVDEFTIPASQKPLRPYMGHGVCSPVNPASYLGTLERQSQVVYFAMEPTGDYPPFNDRSLFHLPVYMVTPDNLSSVRGLGSVVHRVEIPERTYSDTRRAQFRRDLLHILTYDITTPALEQADTRVVAVVRLFLTNNGEWDTATIDLLCLQIGFEFGWKVPEAMERAD